MFGEHVRKRRTRLGMSLREFCRRLGEDPSNWSKIERGVLGPPQREGKLRRVAGALGIAEGSADWEELFDLAAVGAGKIPGFVMENDMALGTLPAVFRTMRGAGSPAGDIEKMIGRLMKGLPSFAGSAAGSANVPQDKVDRRIDTPAPDDSMPAAAAGAPGPDGDEAERERFRGDLTRAIERAYMKDAIDDGFYGEDMD